MDITVVIIVPYTRRFEFEIAAMSMSRKPMSGKGNALMRHFRSAGGKEGREGTQIGAAAAADAKKRCVRQHDTHRQSLGEAASEITFLEADE